MSCHEAIWRLFEYPMHEQSHTIYRLAVHLENEQTVYFREGQEEVAVEKAKSKHTTLTAWFELNKNDSFARNINYLDIFIFI